MRLHVFWDEPARRYGTWQAPSAERTAPRQETGPQHPPRAPIPAHVYRSACVWLLASATLRRAACKKLLSVKSFLPGSSIMRGCEMKGLRTVKYCGNAAAGRLGSSPQHANHALNLSV